ncbi:class I SAM-dependent methyltransferase [[Mycobacterium] wendilense]|uniref:Class I SAM-dependent methyltransferase n=1 Tax=[Mycobacterium] wendilense TaxID=3064284 RepID=A0ABN9P3W6_9MYCO|nr:class I SAM-dependent methyltransferase [Mycolicibacterium sp. MU0050]CAJ1584777.1 class I SAM-dependent methyltransferase [Mycolicibacterium sp. MU0050]
MTTLWSAGRYEAVAERIGTIAVHTVEAAERRRPLAGADVVDLACGTGTAAMAAAARGAQVTGVDLTPALLEIAATKAAADGRWVRWVSGDAAATGLAAASFDVAVSSMGIIFVEPARQVAELRRLLRPDGVVAFSSWVRAERNPFYDPMVAVLGSPAATGFAPDQWGDPLLARQRLSDGFDDVDVEPHQHVWEFDSVSGAMEFLTHESPVHVDLFGRVEGDLRERLAAAFREALSEHTEADGTVRFGAPYVLITARRRHDA